MIHSGQKNMSQPPKNHEMLKLYTFNLSLTNPREQRSSRVSQHNSKHHANTPQGEHRAEQRGAPAAQIIYGRHLKVAQVIRPSWDPGT